MYKTTDSAFAAYLSLVKNLPVVTQPKPGGRATFVVLNLDPAEAARMKEDYMGSQFFLFESRRRALLSETS